MNPQAYRSSALIRLIIPVLLLMLAAAVAVQQIGADSVWFDEGWSAYAAVQPTIVDAANADATNPPLYYALLHVHVRLLGDSEFSLRLFSLFAGLIALALAYRLAVDLVDRRAGVLTLALGTTLPLLVWAAREARMYTLLAVLVLLAALAWHSLLIRPTRRAWTLLLLAEVAALYTHNSGPVIFLWLNVTTLLHWGARRSFARPPVVNWIVTQAIVIGLYLPYFVMRFLLLGQANAALSSAPVVTFAFLFDLWRAVWVTPWERVLLTGDGSSLAALALMAAAFAWVVGRRGLWPLVHVLILTAGLIAALMVLANELHSRYLVMIVPLLLVALGSALSRLRPRPISAILTIAFVALGIWNHLTIAGTAFRHDDARGMVQHYADTLSEHDSVIAWSYADRYDLAYYWERLGVTARRITLPEGAGYAAIRSLLPTSGAVALNIWFTQRADYRGMAGCLLADGTVFRPDEFTTYGMTSRTYRDSAPYALETAPRDWVFTTLEGSPVVRLDFSGLPREWAADQAQCLPIRGTILNPIAADLRAAVIVRDDRDRIIAQVDAVFATDDQRTSSLVQPGEIVEAYPLIRLPYGTLPGSYRMYLRIYAEDAYSAGLIPPMGVETRGRDVSLGPWRVAPGARWADPAAAQDIPTRIDAVVGTRRLLGHGLPAEGTVVRNGEVIPITLYWDGTGYLPDVVLSGPDWAAVLSPETVEPPDGIVRDLRLARIPADAEAGALTIALDDGPTLARWYVDPLPFHATPPPEMRALQTRAQFSAAGTLVGLNPTAPDEVELVWLADGPTAIPYTVFIHALDADGRIIAQSDAQPAAGQRPTTGWRTGEYITDRHRWMLREGVTLDQVMAARWIAGLYDAASGARLSLVDGGDAAGLR